MKFFNYTQTLKKIFLQGNIKNKRPLPIHNLLFITLNDLI